MENERFTKDFMKIENCLEQIQLLQKIIYL